MGKGSRLEKRLEELERKDAPPVRVYVAWDDDDLERVRTDAGDDDVVFVVTWDDVEKEMGE